MVEICGDTRSYTSTIETFQIPETSTRHSRAGTIERRVRNAERYVDRVNGVVRDIVEEINDVNGVINENFTRVTQKIDGVTTAIQNSGGINLIKNSVMFAFDRNAMPRDWDVTGDGNLEMRASAEALNNGSISGHIFTLSNKTVRQRVTVRANDENTRYTFSTRIRKTEKGIARIRVFNENEEYLIELAEGESSFFGDYEIAGVMPTMNYFYIEFYGSERK